MSTLLQAHLPFFKVLASLSDKQATNILKLLEESQINAICEIMNNIRHEAFTFSDDDMKMLFNKRTAIRRLTSKEETLQNRKDIVKQEAHFICKLLKILIDQLEHKSKNKNS